MDDAARKPDFVRLLIDGVKAVDAKLVSAVFDKPPEQDCCPECGGTDFFNGYGTCQVCQPM